MQSKKLRVMRVALSLASSLSLLTVTAHAQGVTTEELDDWFYSRLGWGAIIGGLLGALIAFFHLCRLEFKVNARDVELSVDRRARQKFGGWLLAIFSAGAILLCLDAWMIHEFGNINLEFWDALSRVWLNYRTLLILAATLAMFTLLVAVVTRFKSDCRCRYALIPGPRGK